MPLWGVYPLECADDTLYCGVTVDVESRLAAHNAGRGAKYTRSRCPVRLVAFSGYRFTHGEALREEHTVKRLPKQAKQKYVEALASGRDTVFTPTCKGKKA